VRHEQKVLEIRRSTRQRRYPCHSIYQPVGVMTEQQPATIDAAPRYSRSLSISRSLQAIAGVILIVIVGATVLELTTLRRAIVSEAAQQMSRLDMVFAEQTGRAVQGVDFLILSTIEALQAQRAAGPPDPAAFDALLERRSRGVRQLTGLAVTDASGHIIDASHPGIDTLSAEGSAAQTFHMANPQAALRFSKPFRGSDGKWTALLTRGISDQQGRVTGMVAAYLNLAYFEDFYRAVELPANGSIILLQRDGTVLARFPHADSAIGSSFADTPPFKDVLSHQIAGTLLMESPIDASIRVTAIRALQAFPLAVMVSVEQAELLSDWQRQAWTFTLAAIFATAMIVGLLLRLARKSQREERLVHEFRAAKDSAERAHRAAIEQMEERERAEAALRQAQRIEAVGQLTGGVAHDFNNLLTVLVGNMDLIEATGLPDPRARARLIAMRAAATRAATLTGHLLAFARRQPLLPRAVDLNAVVNGMRELLLSALGERVQMDLRLAKGLCPAMVDPTQIELVILNLVINARDAMPNGGRVTIQTNNHRARRPGCPEQAAESDYVVITVRDAGTGMTPEVQAKAFEPFFTTKEPGAGSGLGLSQVFGTARQSGGDVQIDSAPGEGTAVSVMLPRAAVQADRAPALRVGLASARPGPAVVLVVDDDDAVRSTTADVVNGLGYTVEEAHSGAEALARLNSGGAIDLLLTDVAMPGMSGPELARRARASRPHLPIIFISGYANPEGIAGELLGPLVRKPFTTTDLREQIEQGLSEMRVPAI
jgi:signal transduction histidine kinase/CheY-like chemotaxis protein